MASASVPAARGDYSGTPAVFELVAMGPHSWVRRMWVSQSLFCSHYSLPYLENSPVEGTKPGQFMAPSCRYFVAHLERASSSFQDEHYKKSSWTWGHKLLPPFFCSVRPRQQMPHTQPMLLVGNNCLTTTTPNIWSFRFT